MNDLITRIEAIVDEYGIDAVNIAITFITKYNESIKPVTFKVGTFTLTEDQYKKVRDAYLEGSYTNNGYTIKGSQIHAIKALREITLCGLKEAKDAIESTNLE